MSELKQYTVPGPGGRDTSVLLSDDDAKARGLSGGQARDTEYATPPLNTDGSAEQETARTATEDTPVVGADEAPSTKARASRNK